MTDLHTIFRWPESPSLLPEVREELELHGVDCARSWLMSHDDTRRDFLDRLGNANVRRAEVEDWLKWNNAQSAYWIKVGTVAAIAAALFSFLTLVK